MPKYRVLAKSFINSSVQEEGAIVEYDGEVSDNLEPLEDDKPKRSKKGASAPGESEEQAGE